MSGRERRLAEAFAELDSAVANGAGMSEVLQLLTVRCVELLGAEAAGALLADESGRAWTSAGSDERASRLARLELRDGWGPCTDSHREAAAVGPVGAGEAEERWPRFAAQAHAGTLSVAWAVPLRRSGTAIGALTLFRADPEGAAADAGAHTPADVAGAEPARLTADDVAVAQALADAVAIGITERRALRRSELRAEQLQSALTSRILVEQAKGLLAERWGVSPDGAFVALRRYARTHRLRLSEVARQVVGDTLDSEALRDDVDPAR